MEGRTKLGAMRRWIIVQKYVLQRGWTWSQVPMMGVIFASAIKTVLPGMFNNWIKFAILTIACFVVLYLVGYTDKKLRFLYEDSNYMVEISPLMMRGLRGELKKEDETK